MRLEYNKTQFSTLENILITDLYDNNALKSLKICEDNDRVIYDYLIEFDKEYKVLMIIENDQTTFKITPDIHPKYHMVFYGLILKTLDKQDIKLPYLYENNDYKAIKKFNEEVKYRRKLEELNRLSFTSKKLIAESRSLFESKMDAFLLDDKYELTPEISLVDGLKVSYKIGNNKKYIIKSINALLNQIDENEYHKYGKELAFTHSLESFDDFSKTQIKFLKKARQIFEGTIDNDYYFNNTPTITRFLDIDYTNIDIFYDTYVDYNFNNFYLDTLDYVFNVKIYEEYGLYIIDLNERKDFIYSPKHIYQLEGNVLYRLNIEGDNDIKFINELIKDKIVCTKEDFNDLNKYVLSTLKDSINIISDIKTDDNDYSLIKIYGDVNDESQIFFKIYYFNEKGDRVDGFDKSNILSYRQEVCERYIGKFASFINYDEHIAYLDFDNDKVNEFLHVGINRLNEFAEVFISEALKKLGQETKYNITVGVRVDHDLLALDINSDQIPKGEIANVLAQYRRKKKFYRLKNGDLLYLESKELDEVSKFMDNYHIDSKDIDDGEFYLSKNHMFSIDEESLSDTEIVFEREESFKNVLDDFKKKDEKDYPLNEPYKSILRDYQKHGYVWLKTLNDYGFNGILADDMGLGKTIQVMALLESIKTDKPSIVICPSSLIYNWQDEVNKFNSHLNTICIISNQSNREMLINSAKANDLLITSYDYMRRDYELYQDIEFEYVILDEAQYIKNQKTKNAYSVKQLKARHKLALTGTPIENSLAELWSIMDFLMPKYLYNYHYFQKQFENDIVKNNDEEKINELRKLVSPFILRRNKKEVLKELPDKIEKTYTIPFEEKENELYFANLASANDELQKIFKMDNPDKLAILALLTRLRQLCLDPRLVYENIKESSSKVKATLDLIESHKNNNQKILLFSSFTSIFELLEEELKLRGIKYQILTGKTNKEDRRQLVNKFQEGEVDVFLISLKAGGTGLNLTKAEVVIHFDPWWNMSAQNQATDRAHRIGQENNVTVYKMVMKDSIEEKIIELQNKKKELADMFVENNEGSISSMSKDDILNLFK